MPRHQWPEARSYLKQRMIPQPGLVCLLKSTTSELLAQLQSVFPTLTVSTSKVELRIVKADAPAIERHAPMSFGSPNNSTLIGSLSSQNFVIGQSIDLMRVTWMAARICTRHSPVKSRLTHLPPKWVLAASLAISRRNIKGRPFWSRVLSVRLEPPPERNALNG